MGGRGDRRAPGGTATYHLQIHSWGSHGPETWNERIDDLAGYDDVTGAWLERQGFALARSEGSRVFAAVARVDHHDRGTALLELGDLTRTALGLCRRFGAEHIDDDPMMPAAVEMIRAGICETRPSPTVNKV